MASPNLTNRPSEAAKYSDIERRLLSLEQSILSIPSRQPTTRMLSHRQMFTKASHGFSAGYPVRWNGSAFVTATADTLANAIFDGIVESVPDANTFVLVYDGLMTSSLSGGPVYYVQTSAGVVGTTPGTVTMPAVLRTSGGVVVFRPDLQLGPSAVGLTVGGWTKTSYSYTGSTATHTFAGGTTTIIARIIGGGGGGEGGMRSGSNTSGSARGGCGGGQGAISMLMISKIAGTASIFVGNGGAGGAAGGSYGGTGTGSSVTISGVSFTSNGGQGGGYNSSVPGAGGKFSTSDTTALYHTPLQLQQGESGSPPNGLFAGNENTISSITFYAMNNASITGGAGGGGGYGEAGDGGKGGAATLVTGGTAQTAGDSGGNGIIEIYEK